MKASKPGETNNSRAQRVLRYHDRTKHHPHAYARSLGYMDWNTQPDPFRRFEGAPELALDIIPPTPGPGFDRVLAGRVEPSTPVGHRFVSQLFFDSLALSAWKAHQQARWSLRVNPSSGNLHPTEGYLIAGPETGLGARAGVHHYAPLDHLLELRRELSGDQWVLLKRGLPEGAVLVGLTSIYWRESWKYGERAFRYCQHDAGHAIAAVALAAAALGWEARLLECVVDQEIATLLGVEGQEGVQGAEAEHADVLIALHPRGAHADAGWERRYRIPADLLTELRATTPLGTPNTLSESHHPWPVIDDVGDASTQVEPPPTEAWKSTSARAALDVEPCDASARGLFRQRRSAVAMDGTTTISLATFVRMLASMLPGAVPFDALPWRPRVHLLLFVHRVDGLDPGTYCLVRDAARRDFVASVMSRGFAWTRASGTPPELGLYLLSPGDCRHEARMVSCHQDIASDGAFAVAMLAEYETSILELGASFYRRLHWEAGAVGQVLYLEAEAAGIRSTGIGCFFDDALHELVGIRDRRLQTLYHFTVGAPVDDPRLQTLGAYDHLSK